MMNKQTTGKITALYSRLSREDMLTGDSLSIQNQRDILDSYAAQHGFTHTRHFFDDGTSGVHFDRDGWQQLIEEVEAGRIGTVITKDLSRLGREHIQAGMYLELFRQNGIRFIAITNGVDSINPESLEYVPFLNIFSEWFARDTSKKIKAVAHAKGNAGKPLSYNAIYGFMKSPDDKNVWLVDEYPASIVRRIFGMSVGGMGPYQIARLLTMDKIEKPSYYFAKNRMAGLKQSSRDLSEPYTWSGGTIRAILSKPEYCGHTVNFRTRKESYKDKGFKWNPKEEWKVFPNTHPAIIEQETFDTVQKLRDTPRRPDKLGTANPLTGLVYCVDCDSKMYNSRQAKVIRELVLDRIRHICQYVRENETEFIEKLRTESAVRQAETAKSHQRQLAKNDRRIAELDHLFKKVYEDNAIGKLSDDRFGQMSGDYEREQAELKMQSAALQAELDAFHADTEKAGQFIELVRRYRDFEELTTEMLNEFVHRIYVFEADKSSGERRQKVAIYLNLIGDFDAPGVMNEMTPAEKKAEDKRQFRLAKQREANRRHYAKKKAEQEKAAVKNIPAQKEKN